MSAALLARDRFFEWDRYVGTDITPVDAVQQARDAGQSFTEYAQAFADQNPQEDISSEDLVSGMVGSMNQAAHNLANFRVTGNEHLAHHSDTIFAHNPDDPNTFYGWVETAPEEEILERVNAGTLSG